MAISTDYDAPRHPVGTDLAEDSLEELTARRANAQSPSVDVDDSEAGFELPGAELPDEELTVPVVPMRLDEFRLMSRPAGRDVTDVYAVA